MLRYLTAGESHGEALVAILEGMPAGLSVGRQKIDRQLRRRQAGFGRGKRMQIEKDTVRILAGTRKGISLGSPIALLIKNKDHSIEKLPAVLAARPGHADLCGALKYGFNDARNVLERASARETAARVAVGAVCGMLLDEFGVTIESELLSVGAESGRQDIRNKILEAKGNGDTVGGIFEVTVKGAPCGLGSYAHADRRLDGRLAQAVMSIPGIKSVEIGLGLGYAVSFGSEVHDAIYYNRNKGYLRKTNNAGGIEGGISNGEEIVIRACMKPIATLLRPLDSVNIVTRKPAKASVERSDVCAVEAAGVVAESAVAFILAQALLEKFGCDNLTDIKTAYQNYLKRVR